MKWYLIFLAVCLAEVNGQNSTFRTIFKRMHREPPPPVSVFRNNINMNYITQNLDHFDPKETRTFQMRYLSNDFYFKENGPMFIFVGGEWDISDGYLRGGHMFDMARSLNGYMFYTEHRYYGRSHPFKDLRTENLKYLNVRQALADLRHFIVFMKATIPGLKNSKVILVGGSYSATMVTWFSHLYPDVVDGAWASSAPLLAKVDFKEYKEVVGQSIAELGGQDCYDRIQNAVRTLEAEVESGSIETLRKYFHICPNFNVNNKMDVMSLFGVISDIFSGLVQYHWFGDIEGACEMITSAEDDVSGLGAYLADYLGPYDDCYDLTYEADVADLSQTGLDDSDMFRQWYYQTCNEFGWYQTSSSENQPFGKNFPVELYTSLCEDIYDKQFDAQSIDQNVKFTNDLFGELQPNVTNVYFTHGKVDPWSPMGIQCSGECGAVVPFYSHCADFGSRSSYDTPEMANLKDTIFELVKKWVA